MKLEVHRLSQGRLFPELSAAYHKSVKKVLASDVFDRRLESDRTGNRFSTLSLKCLVLLVIKIDHAIYKRVFLCKICANLQLC